MLQFQEAEKSAGFNEETEELIKDSFYSKTPLSNVTWEVLPSFPKAHAP